MRITKVTTSFIVLVSLVALLEFLSAFAATVPPQKARGPKRPDSWRNQPPKADSPRPFKLPVVRETKLENGLTVLFIEDHRAPIVTILVGIPVATDLSGDISRLTGQM